MVVGIGNLLATILVLMYRVALFSQRTDSMCSHGSILGAVITSYIVGVGCGFIGVSLALENGGEMF